MDTTGTEASGQAYSMSTKPVDNPASTSQHTDNVARDNKRHADNNARAEARDVHASDPVERDTEDSDSDENGELEGILEALIFASDEALTFKQIKDLIAPDQDSANDEQGNDDIPGRRRKRSTGMTITRVKRAIDSLNKHYREHGRAFRIVEVSGGFAFQTIPAFGSWVGRLFAERSRRRLTQSALETLAIVAFRQPISKPAIENIRGVNAEYVVKSLLERNLISIVGRDDSPGRPLLYGTTKTFLKHFGLSSINDLPKPREIEDILVSDEEFSRNPIEEMEPDQAAKLSNMSSRELEQLFDTARLKAERRNDEDTDEQAHEHDAPSIHVTFDSNAEMTTDVDVDDTRSDTPDAHSHAGLSIAADEEESENSVIAPTIKGAPDDAEETSGADMTAPDDVLVYEQTLIPQEFTAADDSPTPAETDSEMRRAYKPDDDCGVDAPGQEQRVDMHSDEDLPDDGLRDDFELEKSDEHEEHTVRDDVERNEVNDVDDNEKEQ